MRSLFGQANNKISMLHVTRPLWGVYMGHQWIASIKDQNVESVLMSQLLQSLRIRQYPSSVPLISTMHLP